MLKEYEKCSICPRNCHVNRNHGKLGICGVQNNIKVARAALHFWEEPCISGTRGSGAVFFTGCSLHCVYCQNQEIARGIKGKEITGERLTEIFLELQEKGAHNINLVTAGHFLPQIIRSLEEAKRQGLSIPIVYNSSGYETVESLKRLEGLVDIYLPDFKYWNPNLAQKYSHAYDYPEVAKLAIAEMVRQQPEAVFAVEGEEELMKKGVIVRQLLLPTYVEDAKQIVKYLYTCYGDAIYLSLMSQFTPLSHVAAYEELNRKVSKEEYDAYVDYAIALGVEQGFIQEEDVAEESFIPAFDYEGVEKLE